VSIQVRTRIPAATPMRAHTHATRRTAPAGCRQAQRAARSTITGTASPSHAQAGQKDPRPVIAQIAASKTATRPARRGTSERMYSLRDNPAANVGIHRRVEGAGRTGRCAEGRACSLITPMVARHRAAGDMAQASHCRQTCRLRAGGSTAGWERTAPRDLPSDRPRASSLRERLGGQSVRADPLHIPHQAETLQGGDRDAG
jgi:hypothetical protein